MPQRRRRCGEESCGRTRCTCCQPVACRCGSAPEWSIFGVHPRQMGATWCPECYVGQWKCLYPFMELPASAHQEILAYLDGLSATLLGQTCLELLAKPAPECKLTPVPAFLAWNGLQPKARPGTQREMWSDVFLSTPPLLLWNAGTSLGAL